MRHACLTITCCSLLIVTFAQPCSAIDWRTFDNPQAVLQTSRLAKEISDLPAAAQDEAKQRLVQSLASTDVEVQRRAALTLGELGDKQGVPRMIAALTTATGRDRDNIVVALRILKDERAIPALRGALKDESPYVRGIAVSALGELKAVATFDAIVSLTTDKDDKREKELGKLNCLPMSPALSACYALGALGDRRAIPILIEILADKDLQGPASQSLEMLTKQKFGKDAQKWQTWWQEQAK